MAGLSERLGKLEERVQPGARLLVIEGVSADGTKHWYDIMTGKLLLSIPPDAVIVKRFGLSLIDL